MQLGKPVLTLIAALGLTLGLAVPSAALTLADLNAGAGFASLDGTLSFGFEADSVVVAGALSTDLSDYQVVARDRGFEIVGPIGVADGNDGDIALRYTVGANIGVIDAAWLFFNGLALGSPGAGASVAEDLFWNGELVASLGVGVTSGGLSVKTDHAGFRGYEAIEVWKGIQVFTTGNAQLASISVITQEFNVVPEPAALVMLSSGVLGLFLIGRKRRQPATRSP